MTNPFILHSPFGPAGDQPKAIEKHEILTPPALREGNSLCELGGVKSHNEESKFASS